MAYQQEAIRRGGTTPEMDVGRRHPKGWADLQRRATLLVVDVVGVPTTSASSRLARLAFKPSATALVFS